MDFTSAHKQCKKNAGGLKYTVHQSTKIPDPNAFETAYCLSIDMHINNKRGGSKALEAECVKSIQDII